ncbi:MAG: FAD/NAD(P)-binding oxidoreductase, partial [Bacteroidota bacterium]
GHEVHLYEASDKTGGQFNMAKLIPGKEEFYETLRYFNKQVELTGVFLHLNTRADANLLSSSGFDEVILATGVNARKIDLEGCDHPKVLSYIDVLLHQKPVGKSVAIIGAGGIGFDVAEYLTHEGKSSALDTEQFMEEWGVDMKHREAGALQEAEVHKSPREVYLLKRSKGKHGKYLGKTTGWIHRASLKKKGVQMLGMVTYDKVDDAGLHIRVGDEKEVLPVDHVVICAGQEPFRALFEPLQAKGINVHLIGGADEAKELDAKRAIKQGAELAAKL